MITILALLKGIWDFWYKDSKWMLMCAPLILLWVINFLQRKYVKSGLFLQWVSDFYHDTTLLDGVTSNWDQFYAMDGVPQAVGLVNYVFPLDTLFSLLFIMLGFSVCLLSYIVVLKVWKMLPLT